MENLIILEDDDEDLEFITEGILSTSQVNIIHVRSALELFGLLSQNSELMLSSVLIVDLYLPYIDGYQILVDIKNHITYRKIPVVILTSSILDEEKCLNAGCTRYFLKPNSLIEYELIAQEVIGILTAHCFD